MFLRSRRLSVQFMQGSVTKHPCGIFGERGGGGGLQYKRRPNLFHRASLPPRIGGTRLSGVRSAIHQRPTMPWTILLLLDSWWAVMTQNRPSSQWEWNFGMSQHFFKYRKNCECCPLSCRCQKCHHFKSGLVFVLCFCCFLWVFSSWSCICRCL